MTDQTIPRLARMEAADGTTTEATFFGPPGAECFGVTHLPAGEPRGAVLVCSPVHLEFMKNNRREVVLSRHLAAAGYAVQRFHYRGTGYSDGEIPDITVGSMEEDARTALQHLQARAGTDRLGFIGTRLAAIPASRLAAEHPGSVLAMWEPARSGAAYFRSMMRSLMMRNMRQGGEQQTVAAMVEEFQQTGSLDMLGFSIPWGFYEDGQSQDLEVGRLLRVLLLQLSRSERLRSEYEELRDEFAGAGARVTAHSLGRDEAWWFQSDGYDPAETAELNDAIIGDTTAWFAQEVAE